MGSIGVPPRAATFPSAQSTPTFWRSELHSLDSHRSASELPQACDILIIGAGYAGISSAYHLLCNEEISRPSPPPSVVLIEARQACSGASGRNGGHLRPSIFGRLPRYLKAYGIEAVLELVDFESDQVDVIANVVKKENIDCDFTPTKTLNVYVKRDEATAAERACCRLKEAAGENKRVRETRWIDELEAEKISGIKGALGCFEFTAAHLSPYKLIMSLLRRAVDSGLNLQTHTPADYIFPSPVESGKWIVRTPRGCITASKVIFATNGYTAGLLPEYTSKIVPSKGICCRIVYTPDQNHVPLNHSYCMWLANGSADYLMARHDNSIIVGGARSDFFETMSNWYNRTDDDSLIEPAKHYFDNYMQKHFLGWEKSDARVDQIWSGIMGYNSDSLPNLGPVPDRPGCFLQAGFQGNGMPTIWLTAKAIVEMVLTGKSYDEVRLPNLYRTTKTRLNSSTDHMFGRP